MTVAELMEVLQDVPDHLEVVMSKDAEGNEYSPLSGFDVTNYVSVSTWSGYILDDEDLDELDEEERENVASAFVLWPTN